MLRRPSPRATSCSVKPFDRITLIDDTAFDVEPPRPRPLPPIDPKKKVETLSSSTRRPQVPEERGARGGPLRRDPAEEETLIIHLLEGEPRDFKVKRAEHPQGRVFEDMLLAEGDRLVKDGDYTRAFERFLAGQAATRTGGGWTTGSTACSSRKGARRWSRDDRPGAPCS